jgi:hypothetical protein
MVFHPNPTQNRPVARRGGRVAVTRAHAPAAPAPTGAASGGDRGAACTVERVGAESLRPSSHSNVNLRKSLDNASHFSQHKTAPTLCGSGRSARRCYLRRGFQRTGRTVPLAHSHSALMISWQNSGRSSGTLPVMMLPSRTAGTSRNSAPAFTRSSRTAT